MKCGLQKFRKPLIIDVDLFIVLPASPTIQVLSLSVDHRKQNPIESSLCLVPVFRDTVTEQPS